MTHFVDIDEVSVSYNLGEPPVLEGASLQMSKGEFVALVGPSGCGKSTFMKLMSGLLKADQGSVVVANQEVTRPLGNVGMAFLRAYKPKELPLGRTKFISTYEDSFW